VNLLAIVGVLEICPGHGVYVLDPHARLATRGPVQHALEHGFNEDLFEACRLVEVESARLAAPRRTANDLAELGAILGQHARAIRPRAAVQHVRVHARLARASANDVLASAVQCLAERLGERGRRLDGEPGYFERELREHRAVFGAVQAADADGAAARMRSHLDAVAAWHISLTSSASIDETRAKCNAITR
jgi:DNA-binding FadR family transcriptional regulator